MSRCTLCAHDCKHNGSAFISTVTWLKHDNVPCCQHWACCSPNSTGNRIVSSSVQLQLANLSAISRFVVVNSSLAARWRMEAWWASAMLALCECTFLFIGILSSIPEHKNTSLLYRSILNTFPLINNHSHEFIVEIWIFIVRINHCAWIGISESPGDLSQLGFECDS